jgi:predicted glycogen debranching enzyme
MQPAWKDHLEWLETDALGGFASGTVGGIRTRRYHGLLLSAVTPPTGRFMLVNGLEIFVNTPAGRFALSSQRYDGQVIAPEGYKHIETFADEPWPKWTYRLPDGTVVQQQILMKQNAPLVAVSWRVVGSPSNVSLDVRPLLSGRDYHSLHRENLEFNFNGESTEDRVRWQPYPSVPSVVASTNGVYRHEPCWYRNFFYQEEWLRGFEATEDLGSPGSFEFDLSKGEAILILSAHAGPTEPLQAGQPVEQAFECLVLAERNRRRRFATRLERAGDQYIVRRGGGEGKSIIAGYPWFADWGRDTFISLRGLCLATHRLDDARAILVSWSRYVSGGLLPNRFPDAGEELENNTVDAALWYVIAVLEFLQQVQRTDYFLPESTREMLLDAVEEILNGYAEGTQHGIRLDQDGLLAAGAPGLQLTWMDARVGERVVTPRIGKAVEVQALWLNALHLAVPHFRKWREPLARGIESFRRRFWNQAGGCLYDVIDVDHVAGTMDDTFRPNQILAVGGLPLELLDPERASIVVGQVERRLLTPLGLRSLDTGNPSYASRYTGNGPQRDAVYHQGAVWPWLIGAFVEAWVRVNGSTNASRRTARKRFFEPLMRHLREGGIGHISEIADGGAPHMPRGCPFQAWSVAEALRLDLDVLREAQVTVRVTPSRPRQKKVVRRQRVLEQR